MKKNILIFVSFLFTLTVFAQQQSYSYVNRTRFIPAAIEIHGKAKKPDVLGAVLTSQNQDGYYIEPLIVHDRGYTATGHIGGDYSKIIIPAAGYVDYIQLHDKTEKNALFVLDKESLISSEEAKRVCNAQLRALLKARAKAIEYQTVDTYQDKVPHGVSSSNGNFQDQNQGWLAQQPDQPTRLMPSMQARNNVNNLSLTGSNLGFEKPCVTNLKNNHPEVWQAYLIQKNKSIFHNGLSVFNNLGLTNSQKKSLKKCVSGKSGFVRNLGWAVPVVVLPTAGGIVASKRNLGNSSFRTTDTPDTPVTGNN